MEFKGTKDLGLESGMIVGDDIVVCEMQDYNEENKANAQLFITAPRLLEALIEMHKKSYALTPIERERFYRIEKLINEATKTT